MNTPEHLFTCLAEEGVEVSLEISKLASKINRFGLHDRNFLNPGGPTNAERLIEELNDLIAVVDMLAYMGVLPLDWSSNSMQSDKKQRLLGMMELAKQNRTLQPTEAADAS